MKHVFHALYYLSYPVMLVTCSDIVDVPLVFVFWHFVQERYMRNVTRKPGDRPEGRHSWHATDLAGGGAATGRHYSQVECQGEALRIAPKVVNSWHIWTVREAEPRIDPATTSGTLRGIN